jgi:hypothetical protein
MTAGDADPSRFPVTAGATTPAPRLAPPRAFMLAPVSACAIRLPASDCRPIKRGFSPVRPRPRPAGGPTAADLVTPPARRGLQAVEGRVGRDLPHGEPEPYPARQRVHQPRGAGQAARPGQQVIQGLGGQAGAGDTRVRSLPELQVCAEARGESWLGTQVAAGDGPQQADERLAVIRPTAGPRAIRYSRWPATMTGCGRPASGRRSRQRDETARVSSVVWRRRRTKCRCPRRAGHRRSPTPSGAPRPLQAAISATRPANRSSPRAHA